jgi:hypothetical protein
MSTPVLPADERVEVSFGPDRDLRPGGLFPGTILSAKDDRGRVLSGSDLRVYLALRTLHSPVPGDDPRVAEIASRANVSLSVTGKSILRLREMGLLKNPRHSDTKPEPVNRVRRVISNEEGPVLTSGRPVPIQKSTRTTEGLSLAQGPVPVLRQVSAPRRVPINARRTCVYRHYDADDVLLYVGMTSTPSTRETSHVASAIWHGLSKRRTETWYPNRRDAEQAETEAISREYPLFNIDGNVTEESQRRVWIYLNGKELLALWDIHQRRIKLGSKPKRRSKKPNHAA